MDNLKTESVATPKMAQQVDELLAYFNSQRKNFERRWYDNNFFDDGFHFRYVSRTTGKIISPQENDSIMPTRAIPKASRQIRGIANLLLSPDYVPSVRPERVSPSMYPPVIDPQTGQQMPNQQYQQAVKAAQKTAKRIGHWITEEWEEQELEDKLVLMVINAMKHGVSFMQCWPDAISEKIKTQVYDAFDIYLNGSLNNPYDSPAIIKTTPMLITQILANEMFDEEAKAKLTPDNKYSESIVKEAYMRARFGQMNESDMAKTLILKEAFIKEYVNNNNAVQITESLGDKAGMFKPGDQIIRQTFTADGVTLRDEYTTLREYPFIDFRMEPGPIYQVPQIERFIPANKSLDIVMSRLERYFNTMISGSWLVRKGENIQITNIPGGQKLEYDTTPPTQAAMANPQSAVFPYISSLNQIIEEQGASTSALNQLPQGVKSGVAIESVKQTEYANLHIPAKQLKRTVRLISERLIEYVADFIEPKEVMMLEDNEPTYYDIIGENGYNLMQKLGTEMPKESTVVIGRETKVQINVEQGMGLTPEGQKQTMQNLVQFFLPLAQNNMIPPEAIKQVVGKLFEMYGYGATQELMESMDEGTVQMNEEQLMQVKVAVAEVLKDAQLGGQQAEQRAVMASKVGTLEALKESGMAEKIMGKNGNANKISESMSYKDAPPSIKRQMEQQAGFEPASQDEHQVEQAQQVKSIMPQNAGPNKKS